MSWIVNNDLLERPGDVNLQSYKGPDSVHTSFHLRCPNLPSPTLRSEIEKMLFIKMGPQFQTPHRSHHEQQKPQPKISCWSAVDKFTHAHWPTGVHVLSVGEAAASSAMRVRLSSSRAAEWCHCEVSRESSALRGQQRPERLLRATTTAGEEKK